MLTSAVEGFLTVKFVIPAEDSDHFNQDHHRVPEAFTNPGRHNPLPEPEEARGGASRDESVRPSALLALRTGTTWKTRGSQQGFQVSRKPALWLQAVPTAGVTPGSRRLPV